MIRFLGDKSSILNGYKRQVQRLLKRIAEDHNRIIGELDYILLDDEAILRLNKESLNHDYYTDIITFDYSEGKTVESEIYISIERVKENAKKYGDEFHVELIRVISHGLLHIVGYKDKSKSEKTKMREKENQYIKLYKDLFHVERM